MIELNQITVGQLWMSITEPSLGIGRVKKCNDGFINIFFPQPEILRKYYALNAPLERIIFQSGDKILLKDGKMITISEVDNNNGLLYYKNGKVIVCETDISDNTIFETSVNRLIAGDYETNEDFDLRYYTHQAKNYVAKSPCKGIIGARIDLMPHQLFISHQISQRYAPRAILADEVGLGKTIEACLILKYLISSRSYHNILIITPEHLIIQWFSELFHRFNLTFGFVDNTYYNKKKHADNNFRPVEKNDRCILSYNLLEKDGDIQKQVLNKRWDLIVVDEAHHIEDGSVLYGIIEKITDMKKGIILLSAAPDYPGLQHYFARLKLIDPSSFFQFDRFFWELEKYHEIADIAEKIIQNEEITDNSHEMLKDMLLKSRGYEHLVKDNSVIIDDNTNNEIIDFLMTRHGIGRFLFRNTRKNLNAFPQRCINPVPLIPVDEKNGMDLLIEELNYDTLNSPNEPEYNYKFDPRLEWLLGFLHQNKHVKILLICRTMKKAVCLKKALLIKNFSGFEIFHEDMDIIERDKKAARFYNNDEIRILISSEIGSEGRNFQFCNHLVFFDIPCRADLIEQRIGRLDRIGQKNDINIHIPFITGSPQEYLILWLHQGLDAFNSSLQGCENIFNRYLDYLKKIIFLNEPREEILKQLEQIIQQTYMEKKEVMANLDRGRDRLVELNSFRPVEAKKIVDILNDYDSDPYIEYYLNDFFEYIGINQEVISNRTYRLNAETVNIELFPEINKKDFFITYDRKLAIEREDIEFFTIDHPFIERAFQFVLGSGKGSSVISCWISDNDNKLIAELVFIIETLSPVRLNIERFLPQSYIKIVIDDDLMDMTNRFDSDSIMEELENINPGKYRNIKPLIDQKIKPMVKEARSLAYKKTESFIDRAKNQLEKMYDREIKRLENLMLINSSIKEDEIEFIRDEKKEIYNYLDNTLLRLDGIRVIVTQESEVRR